MQVSSMYNLFLDSILLKKKKKLDFLFLCIIFNGEWDFPFFSP